MRIPSSDCWGWRMSRCNRLAEAVRTAHGTPSSGHVAKFEGVDNAAVIRDLIVERLRVYRDSGLGEKTVEARESLALSAAREVLQETRALRNSLASGLGST